MLLLPSSEKLWQAETCQQWFRRLDSENNTAYDPSRFQIEENSRPTAQEAIRRLCTELSLCQPMSAFSNTALVHMLIQRIWYAEQYLNDPIRGFSEQSGSQSQVVQTKRNPEMYLGANPEFAKWRNTTCDCLDVLHWEALSISAKAGGYESPVFLSLHLSRLLVLTPVKELFGYFHEFARSSQSCLPPHILYGGMESGQCDESTVMTWYCQDRYKARLALVHAGAMFWHVRRYGAESFVQPFAVYLATIVLWGFGFCARRDLTQLSFGKQQVPNLQRGLEVRTELSPFGGATQEHPPAQVATVNASAVYADLNAVDFHPRADPRMPSQMQLDRPVDDELVQHFIRHGDLKLYLEGVPDLCSTEGPLQALQEGVAILKGSTSVWSITERYIHCLEEAIVAPPIT